MQLNYAPFRFIWPKTIFCFLPLQWAVFSFITTPKKVFLPVFSLSPEVSQTTVFPLNWAVLSFIATYNIFALVCHWIKLFWALSHWPVCGWVILALSHSKQDFCCFVAKLRCSQLFFALEKGFRLVAANHVDSSYTLYPVHTKAPQI